MPAQGYSASARLEGSLLKEGVFANKRCSFYPCLTCVSGSVQVDHIIAQYLLQQRYVTQNASRTETEVMLSAGPWIYTQALIAWIQDQGQDPLQVATEAPSMVGDVAIMGQQVQAFLSCQERCTSLAAASSRTLVCAMKVQPVHGRPLVSDHPAAAPAAWLPAQDECFLGDPGTVHCMLQAFGYGPKGQSDELPVRHDITLDTPQFVMHHFSGSWRGQLKPDAKYQRRWWQFNTPKDPAIN